MKYKDLKIGQFFKWGSAEEQGGHPTLERIKGGYLRADRKHGDKPGKCDSTWSDSRVTVFDAPTNEEKLSRELRQATLYLAGQIERDLFRGGTK